jgi:hypothetical protein
MGLHGLLQGWLYRLQEGISTCNSNVNSGSSGDSMAICLLVNVNDYTIRFIYVLCRIFAVAQVVLCLAITFFIWLFKNFILYLK